jgi:hypothetical protein
MPIKKAVVKKRGRPKAVFVPRNEQEVMAKIDDWCKKCHPHVKVQKSEYSKLIESTGEKKVIDATIIGKYSKRARAGEHGCIISELEFEEHKANYSILKDMLMITIPLRKLDYWRNDIAQFWIKVDKDGTPFMINFRHIKANENNLDKMKPTGRWQKNNQITRIITAQRKSKEAAWPDYVIVGWDEILCELDRIIKLAKF